MLYFSLIATLTTSLSSFCALYFLRLSLSACLSASCLCLSASFFSSIVIPLSSSLSLSPVPGTDGIDPMGFIILSIIILLLLFYCDKMDQNLKVVLYCTPKSIFISPCTKRNPLEVLLRSEMLVVTQVSCSSPC